MQLNSCRFQAATPSISLDRQPVSSRNPVHFGTEVFYIPPGGLQSLFAPPDNDTTMANVFNAILKHQAQHFDILLEAQSRFQTQQELKQLAATYLNANEATIDRPTEKTPVELLINAATLKYLTVPNSALQVRNHYRDAINLLLAQYQTQPDKSDERYAYLEDKLINIILETDHDTAITKSQGLLVDILRKHFKQIPEQHGMTYITAGERKMPLFLEHTETSFQATA